MKFAFILILSILSVSLADPAYDVGGVYTKQNSDLLVKAFGDVLKNAAGLTKGGEVAVVKQLPQYNGFVEGAVGVTHSNTVYAGAKAHAAENLDGGYLQADAAVDHFGNYTNGTAGAKFDGGNNDTSYGVFGEGKFDSNGNKDYVLGGHVNKTIDANTQAKAGAILKDQDLKGGVAVSRTTSEFDVVGYAGGEYNLQSKNDDYKVGAAIGKSFLENKLKVGAGVEHTKNGSNTAFAGGHFAENIEGGSVAAGGGVKYDINNKALSSYGVGAKVNKDFGNGLVVGAGVGDKNGAINGGATADYSHNTQDLSANINAAVDYDFNAKQITNQQVSASVDKYLSNGAVGAKFTDNNGQEDAKAYAGVNGSSNGVSYKVGGDVDYNLNSKNATGKGGVEVNTIQNNYNISGFLGLISDLKEVVNGIVGAKISDLKGINTAGVKVGGSFRGGKTELGNIVGTFTHVIDASSNVNFEVTKTPAGDIEAGGCYNKQIDAEQKITVYFKVDKDGNISIA